MVMRTFGKFATDAMSGSGPALLTADIRLLMLDLNDVALAVTAATNATPIAVTVTSHGLATGDRIAIVGVLGNTAANGEFIVTSTGANTFTLQDKNGNNVAGNGAYTSGGLLIKLKGWQFLSDISAGQVAVSANIPTGDRSIVDGVLFVANPITITGVSGDPTECVVAYEHTGTAGTSRLLGIDDAATFLPNSSNVQLTPNAAGLLAIT